MMMIDLDKTQETPFTLDRLQEEVRPWQAHNFGERPWRWPLLGLIEEIGELAEAEDLPKLVDALADIMVFAADLSNALNFRLAEIFERGDKLVDEQISNGGDIDPPPWSQLQGRLAHHLLKSEQGIRGTHEQHVASIERLLADVMAGVHITSHSHELVEEDSIDVLEITRQTWAKVRLRDWTKDKLTAGGHA